MVFYDPVTNVSDLDSEGRPIGNPWIEPRNQPARFIGQKIGQRFGGFRRIIRFRGQRAPADRVQRRRNLRARSPMSGKRLGTLVTPTGFMRQRIKNRRAR